MKNLLATFVTSIVLSQNLAQGDVGKAETPQGEGNNVVFIPLPLQVSTSDVRHAGPSLKGDLYRYIQRWLRYKGTTASAKPPVDLIVILTDQQGRPILPDLDTAKSHAARTTANELSFTFNSPDYPWTTTEVADLMTQLGDYYPTAKEVYGNPAFTIAVNLRKDPTISYAGLYFPSTNEMVVHDTGSQDAICHEMIHAFRDDDIVYLNSYEEGMTRAAEIEVFDRLEAYTHPFDESHSYTYDVYYEALNQSEIGSRNGSFFQTYPNTFVFLRYQLAGYAWGKALLENAQFFGTFNQLLYSAIISDPPTQYTESKLIDIASSVQSTIEGQSFPVWYARQVVLNATPPQGYFLYQRINQYDVSYFYRDASGIETMQADATVNWAVYDYQNILLDSGSGITDPYGVVGVLGNIPENYTGRLKVVTTTSSPDGIIQNIAYRPARDEIGVFGVVLGADSGTVTITSLDSPAPPISVDVTNGSFSISSLAEDRGRFLASFVGTNGRSFAKHLNKDASNYFLLLDIPFQIPGTFNAIGAQTLIAPIVTQASPVPVGSIVQHTPNTDPTTTGYAIFNVHVNTTGGYWLKGNVNWVDGGSNSMFLKFGSQPSNADIWTGAPTSGFEERYFTDPPNFTTPHVFNLTAGDTTLYIGGREADALLSTVTVEVAPTLDVRTYDTGSGTDSVPANANQVVIEIWYPGGGGSRSSGTSAQRGGGSGAYSIKTVTLSSINWGQTFSYSCGTAGAGRTGSTGSGGAASGGLITDNLTSVTVVFAPGTAAQGGVNSGTGVGGTTPTGGDTNTAGSNTTTNAGAGAPNGGGNVAAGNTGSIPGGGGGGGASSNANGANSASGRCRDAKILVGTRSDVIPLFRLNPDGTPDAAFNPNGYDRVYAIAVQADGRILAGGDFTTIGGQTRNYIARLDATNGLADSFNPNANQPVRTIVVQANGKILVGGYFTTFGGQLRSHIARLDATTGLADAPNQNATKVGRLEE